MTAGGDDPEDRTPEQPPEPPPEPASDADGVQPVEPRPEEELSTFDSTPAPDEPAPLSDTRDDLPPTDPPPSLHQRFAHRSESLFGEPEIPMPRDPGADRRRARSARANLDLDLGRIKRRKRFGFFTTMLSVLFIALVLAPVTWVGAYLVIDPPATVLMMQRAAEGESIRYHPTRINRMSPHIVRSVIAAEDANFCTHDGFDVAAIQEAMESNARGGRVRGASTISQQVAKNVFLWPERSWLRKGFETYFTALIEFMWPKRRIMEVYLNVAEWGDGNFGVEAAARARFGVAAADLTPLQAARLAAVLPSPNRWSADNPGPYVRRRSASIVQRARVVRNEHMSGCVLMLDRPDA